MLSAPRLLTWRGDSSALPENFITLQKGNAENDPTFLVVSPTEGYPGLSMVAQAQFLAEEQIGDVTVVKFNHAEILDDRTIGMIAEQLFSLVEHSHDRRFVLDLGGVGKLSATMLGTFLAMHKKLRADGGRLVLCRVDSRLLSLFALFNLPRLIRICKDEQEALQTF